MARSKQNNLFAVDDCALSVCKWIAPARDRVQEHGLAQESPAKVRPAIAHTAGCQDRADDPAFESRRTAQAPSHHHARRRPPISRELYFSGLAHGCYQQRHVHCCLLTNLIIMQPGFALTDDLVAWILGAVAQIAGARHRDPQGSIERPVPLATAAISEMAQTDRRDLIYALQLRRSFGGMGGEQFGTSAKKFSSSYRFIRRYEHAQRCNTVLVGEVG